MADLRNYFRSLNAMEIVNELSKLMEEELRSVRQRLLKLAAHKADMAPCDQAALQGAAMLDRMEEDDARRQCR
jgi:hypothetical protein